MIGYTFYEVDNRVRRYAESFARRGDTVDVISLRRPGQPSKGVLQSVNIYRIQARNPSERNKLEYLGKLMLFLIKSAVFVTRMHFKERYDLIHVHSVPDFEVLAAMIPKITGATIILDIHDIVPEFYASKFGSSQTSVAFKALVWLERMSIAFSDHVIISNHIWHKRLLSRSVSDEKCSVFLNYPDPLRFYERKVQKDGKKLIFLYPGTLNRHQGLEVAIKAFAWIVDEIPEAEFHIYGDGPARANIQTLIDQLAFSNRVFLHDFVPMDEIADRMAESDVGVVPKLNDSFGGEAFSTKIFEFMALGIPVVASATTIDTYYFNDSVIQFFEPSNENDLARAMLQLGKSKELRDSLADRALEFVKEYSWDRKKQEYFDLVDGLVQNKAAIKAAAYGYVYRWLLHRYYYFKPIVPRKLQIYMRRKAAIRKRRIYESIWPIYPRASEKPAGWPGWPGGKRFALVLTHDVESESGLRKCLQLANLEESHGFRSSFNFVAEDYAISEGLLDDLKRRGFEIGVHGIRHRGNLFSSRKAFDKQVNRINDCLKKWGASGFRCPSMYHNLQWMQDLHIDYDLSTFDADPFEPQSDGVGTIFPFIVGRNGSGDGYVELPYTLPQDHLLFVVLKETTTLIWKEKLEWIAEKGGMALLITHPDYMLFDGARSGREEYSADLYNDFLQHVKSRYDGQYWHALPKEVSSFVRQLERPFEPLTSKPSGDLSRKMSQSRDPELFSG